jgi:hypothetical protein
MIFIYSILVVSLLLPIMNPTLGWGQDKPCEILRADLARKDLRLTEYMNTAKKLDERDDREIGKQVSDKIGKQEMVIQSVRERFRRKVIASHNPHFEMTRTS